MEASRGQGNSWDQVTKQREHNWLGIPWLNHHPGLCLLPHSLCKKLATLEPSSLLGQHCCVLEKGRWDGPNQDPELPWTRQRNWSQPFWPPAQSRLQEGVGGGVLAASWGWAAARPGEQSRTHSGQHQEAGSPDLRVRPAEPICTYPQEVCKEEVRLCVNCPIRPAGHTASLSLREMYQLQG